MGPCLIIIVARDLYYREQVVCLFFPILESTMKTKFSGAILDSGFAPTEFDDLRIVFRPMRARRAEQHSLDLVRKGNLVARRSYRAGR